VQVHRDEELARAGAILAVAGAVAERVVALDGEQVSAGSAEDAGGLEAPAGPDGVGGEVERLLRPFCDRSALW
jgi:hypothetical protein